MITKGLLGVVIVLSLALGWMKIQNLGLENDLQVAIVKQEAAEASLRTAQQEKELADTQLANFARKMEEIEAERDAARVQVDKMRDIFQDHDFAKLIARKPGLIENRMIKKTQEVFDEIESLTTD